MGFLEMLSNLYDLILTMTFAAFCIFGGRWQIGKKFDIEFKPMKEDIKSIFKKRAGKKHD